MPTPSEIQTCINNLTTSSQPIDFTLLAAETSDAGTGISFSVPTVNDLPDLSTSNIGGGQIVFVESIGVPVVSTQNEWKGLDGRLLRRDFDIRAIFTWGSNTSGRLGIGNTTVVNACSPVREFCSATDWCQVTVGCTFTSAVKTSGELWAWGDNTCGRLGDGTFNDRTSPVREFCSATDWCQVSGGGCHTAAIKTSGQLWGWGRNLYGITGDGTTANRNSPVRERCSATDWCQVSAGYQHAAAVKTTGQLWVWGRNHCGQLGDGTITPGRCSPVREFCSATDWCQVSAGQQRSAAVKTTGELWAWGLNNYGRLGDGSGFTQCSPVREFCSATDWCRVSGKSFSHTAAVKTSGQLWVWGRGNNGVLGTGTTATTTSPVREFCSATDWCAVSDGGATVAIKTSGQLWGWGGGGMTGDGTNTTRCSPVREFCSATDWRTVDVGPLHVAGIRIS